LSAVTRGRFLATVADTEPRRRLDLRRMIFLSAFWFAIAYLWQSMTFFILPLLVEPAAKQIGIEKNLALSILETVGALFAVVWQPALGALSDRTRFRIGRRRPYIAIGVVGDVVFLTLMTLVTSFWPLLLIYALLQLASNTAQGPYQGMLPDQVPENQRGQASGYYGGLQMAGTLVGPVIIGIVLSKQTGLGILSIALVLAIAGAMVIFGVPDVRTTRPVEHRLGRSLALSFVIDARRYPDFAWLMVSRLLFLMGVGGIQKYALYFIKDHFGFTSEQASRSTAYLLLAITGVAAVVSTSAGYLSERWGRKRMVAGACLICAVGAGLLISVQTFPTLLIYGILLGVGVGTFLSVDWAFATDLIPKGEAGRYMGISNIATAGSGILAGVLMGPVISIFNTVSGGPSPTLGYRVMFGMATAFFLIAFLTLRPVREIKVE
jgi:MFS family permease